jgi:hypothetical protein
MGLRTMAAAAATCMALAACVTTAPEHRMATAYAPADYAAYDAGGDAAIRGQAFLRQVGGGVVTCAGLAVHLFPAAPYTDEAMAAIRRGARISSPDYFAMVSRHVRPTTCDADGRFAFDGLSPGPYWIEATVVWSVAGRPQGGYLLRYVRAEQGRPVDVLLTDRDLR